MAKLAIEGMEFHAFHGYYEEERKVGGKYGVNVYVVIPDDAGEYDDLEHTVNYEAIYAIVNTVMAQPVKLIEHLAGKILKQLVSELGYKGKWTIEVIKFRPPLDGEVGQTSVQMEG